MSDGHHAFEDQERALRKARRLDSMRASRTRLKGIREDMKSSETAEVEVEVLGASARAVKLQGPRGEPVWVPRSVIAEGDALEVDTEPRQIVVALWKLDELGWA